MQGVSKCMFFILFQTNATTSDQICVTGDSSGLSGTARIYRNAGGFSGHLIRMHD